MGGVRGKWIGPSERRPGMRGTEGRLWSTCFLPGALVSFLLGAKQLRMCSVWLTVGQAAEPPADHRPRPRAAPHQSQHLRGPRSSEAHKLVTRSVLRLLEGQGVLERLPATLSTKILKKVLPMYKNPKPRSHLDTISPLSPCVPGACPLLSTSAAPSLQPPSSPPRLQQPPNATSQTLCSILGTRARSDFFKTQSRSCHSPHRQPQGVLKGLPWPWQLSHPSPLLSPLQPCCFLSGLWVPCSLLPGSLCTCFHSLPHHLSPGEPPVILPFPWNRLGWLGFPWSQFLIEPCLFSLREPISLYNHTPFNVNFSLMSVSPADCEVPEPGFCS